MSYFEKSEPDIPDDALKIRNFYSECIRSLISAFATKEFISF